MILSTYIELVQHLEAYANSVTGLKTVTVGADEDTIGAQSSLIKYPHLRIDTPAPQLLDPEDNYRTRFNFVFSVLQNVPQPTNLNENQALSDTLEVLKAVHQRLISDSEDDYFDLILDNESAKEIRRYSADNLFGWYITFKIELYNKTCA
jgi:hypothetical protein